MPRVNRKGESVKALVLHGPGKYTVEKDWPAPRAKEGWALVKVAFAGVCGSDIPRFAVTGSYHHPMILGHEFSGVVEEPASLRFPKGTPVAVLPIIPCGTCEGCKSGEPFHCEHYQFLGSRNDGGFAEYCLVPETNLLRLPDGIDLRAGAFIEPVGVALHAVRRSAFVAKDSCLVFGAGPIGLLIGLWLRALGAKRVVMVDPRSESLGLGRRIGFSEAYAPIEVERMKDTFDLAFEAAGSCRALISAIDRVRNKGGITVVGRDTNDTAIPRASFERLMRKELDLRGCWGYSFHGEEGLAVEQLARGTFHVQDLVTHEVSLDEAPALIDGMIKRQFYYCKTLVGMSQ